VVLKPYHFTHPQFLCNNTVWCKLLPNRSVGLAIAYPNIFVAWPCLTMSYRRTRRQAESGVRTAWRAIWSCSWWICDRNCSRRSVAGNPDPQFRSHPVAANNPL